MLIFYFFLVVRFFAHPLPEIHRKTYKATTVKLCNYAADLILLEGLLFLQMCQFCVSNDGKEPSGG